MKCRTFPARVASGQGWDKCGTQAMPSPASRGPYNMFVLPDCLSVNVRASKQPWAPVFKAMQHAGFSGGILCHLGKHEISWGQNLQPRCAALQTRKVAMQMYAFFNPMQLKHTNIMSLAKKSSREVVLQSRCSSSRHGRVQRSLRILQKVPN